MPFIYVTGIAGAGKSTVRNELLHRGYDAHDTDEDGLSHWENTRNGEITRQAEVSERSEEFSAQNEWKVDPEQVRAIARRVSVRPVFLCGAASNDNEIWELFDIVIHLSIDKATLHRRVTTRTTSDYGKNPNELNALLKWHEKIQSYYQDQGAISIDGTKSVHQVVDDILEVVGEHTG
jgi:adenylate kinase family enzyme